MSDSTTYCMFGIIYSVNGYAYLHWYRDFFFFKGFKLNQNLNYLQWQYTECDRNYAACTFTFCFTLYSAYDNRSTSFKAGQLLHEIRLKSG